MKRFSLFSAFVLVTGSGLWPACLHTSSAVTATSEPYAVAVAAEHSETTCDPETAPAASVAGGHNDVYGDCGAAAQSVARRQDGSLWPRPRGVDRPPRWRRRRRSRLYGGLPRAVTSRPVTVVGRRDGDDEGDGGKSVRTRHPVGGGRRDGVISLEVPRPDSGEVDQPRTGMKKASKMFLYALSMFFEQLELTVYLTLYKIKLLYNTLIKPMMHNEE